MTEQPVWMTPDPWEVEEDRRLASLRRQMTPEERAQHRRDYHRAYRRRQRYGTDAPVVGWLHELKCDGNHHGYSGCKPIPVFSVDEAAA